MARPSKPRALAIGDVTKAETQRRAEAEKRLKGAGDNINAPEHLTDEQETVFYKIVEELEASKILGNLDVYILSTAAIAIDRLQAIESMINEDIELLRDKNLMASKDKYMRDFFKCCVELSLSPQSRAKLSTINKDAKDDSKDELLKILRGNG